MGSHITMTKSKGKRYGQVKAKRISLWVEEQQNMKYKEERHQGMLAVTLYLSYSYRQSLGPGMVAPFTSNWGCENLSVLIMVCISKAHLYFL